MNALPDSMKHIAAKCAALDALRPEVERLKAAGKTIVLANGCFDLLHAGHIRYLRGARAMGDALIVALNSDNAVRRLKGDGRPILPQDHRAVMVAALEMVDFVTIFDADRVDEVLLALKPHIHAKGTDYTEDTVPEKDVVASYGGRVAIAGDPKDHSTSAVIDKIRGKGN